MAPMLLFPLLACAREPAETDPPRTVSPVVVQVEKDAVTDETLLAFRKLTRDERQTVRAALIPAIARSERPETFYLAQAAGPDPAVADAIATRVTRGFDESWGDAAFDALVVLDPARAATLACPLLPDHPGDLRLYRALAAAPSDCPAVFPAIVAGGDTLCQYAEGRYGDTLGDALAKSGGPRGDDVLTAARLHYEMLSPENPDCDDQGIAPGTRCHCRWDLCEVWGARRDVGCEPRFDDQARRGWYVPRG